jgi:UTP--glucose-1-phosphate uridylyltransferase
LHALNPDELIVELRKTLIRKAVIPAGGIGSRLLPVTKAVPKEMLPIVDTPAIQFVIEEAVSSGIESILIVTSSGKYVLEDYFSKSKELERMLEEKGKHKLCQVIRDISSMADIHFIRQTEPLGLGHALLCARHFVGDEPFAVLLPDDLIQSETPCLKEMIQAYEQFCTSVIAVQRVPRNEVDRYGIITPVRLPECSNRRMLAIEDVIEKPSPETAPSDLAVVGRYILEPDLFPILHTTAPGKGGEIQLTDALRVLNQQHQMLAWEIRGNRYDVGNKLGYIQASIEYALSRDNLRIELLAYLRTLLQSPLAADLMSTGVSKS